MSILPASLTRRAKRLRTTVMIRWFPVYHARRLYLSRTGKKLRYRNVQDLNEKLFWLERYWRHPLVARCSDKYLVRAYVEWCGFGRLLNELYGVYDSPEAIDFDPLPDQFVLKCNHGCGYNIFCFDKGTFDAEEALRQLRAWMGETFGRSSAEWHYAGIRRKILAERFLPHEEYRSTDYQIYCFNGKPAFFLARDDRGGKLPGGKAVTYSLDWRQRLPYRIGEDLFEQGFQEPPYREEMIRCAEALSRPFPLVRVDFYGLEDLVVFGELTFSPIGNVLDSYNPEVIAELGTRLQLPPKYRPSRSWRRRRPITGYDSRST